MNSDLDAFAKLVADRSTCRQFLPDPVPTEVIAEILTISQRTPSWCNTQPWELNITSGESTQRFRTALIEHVASGVADAPDIAFPAAYEGTYRQRRKDCAVQLYDSVGIARDDRDASFLQTLRNFDFFDAPHVAIITTDASLGAYGSVDCGLYISTFLLAAQAAGVATAPQAALASYSSFLHRYFEIPSSRLVVAGISFGYPDTDSSVNQFRTPRASTDEAVVFRF